MSGAPFIAASVVGVNVNNSVAGIGLRRFVLMIFPNRVAAAAGGPWSFQLLQLQ
eukprot:SAG31_NODE_138_length_22877_cov_29.540917_7_plen_54_part_00